MASRHFWASLTIIAAVCPAHAAPPLPVEHITIAALPPDNGHRLYAADLAIAHGVDGKVHVFDGDSFRPLGMFSNGSFGAFNASADGKTLYNATTYFSRGDHGTRTEVLEFYDAQTLLPTGEVILPAKRAQATGIEALMPESARGKYLFIQNATPASSVTIIDLARRAFLAEIPTAGCYGVYPAPGTPTRFSTLCGDGAVVTVDFTPTGAETARHRSAVLFDPDADPIYINSAPLGKKTLFISFTGTVHIMDLTGPAATQEKTWSFTGANPATKDWRPGGVQPFAVDSAHAALYTAMHPHGTEGSHKNPATEIWKIDLGTKKLDKRTKSDGAIGISVTPDSKFVFTINGESGSISRYDATTLQKLGQSHAHILEYGGALYIK